MNGALTKEQLEYFTKAKPYKKDAFLNPRYARLYSDYCKKFGFVKTAMWDYWVDMMCKDSKRHHRFMDKGTDKVIPIRTTMMPPNDFSEKSAPSSPLQEWMEDYRAKSMGAHFE